MKGRKSESLRKREREEEIVRVMGKKGESEEERVRVMGIEG